MSTVPAEFANPGVAWRGKPFWSWNGKLEKEELFRQIHVIRDMGMGGFFMHSRTGLATEYLGEEWFKLINDCADEGERLGLDAWLYDEDRWPSGIAGGKVTRNPEFRQKSIFMEICDTAGDAGQGIAQWTAKLDGPVCTDLEPYSGGPLFPGRKRLVFQVVEQEKNSFFNGYTYLDTLNRAATECFIETTHDAYRQQCGDRIGRSIKGMFTDEPNRGSLMTGLLVGKQYGLQTVPYTPKLFDEFRNRFGYDLMEKLPELFLQVDGRRVSPVKWHFSELLMQLFLENFMAPCNDWCERNHLPLTGHVLHEDDLTTQTAMCGSVMRCYEHMRYPGVDVLTENNRQYWVVKQLQSAARQFGQTWLLSELYGCTGWQMTFAGHKAAGDWQALFGINVRCHHLSWYTMQGESKRDYPGSIFYQSAWWPEYHAVETYFARTGWLMSQGKPVCDLLVINPIESVWAQVHVGWADEWKTCSGQVAALNKTYADVFHWLVGAQIDFDYGDEEILSRRASVCDGQLQVGETSYKAILVAGVETIRSSTLRLLRDFAAGGGTVVFAGPPPAYVDAIESEEAAALAKNARQIPLNGAALAGEFDPLAEISGADGAPLPQVFCQMRRTEDGRRILMLLNTDREQGIDPVQVRLAGCRAIEEWDALTGTVCRVPALEQDGRLCFSIALPPGGSCLLVATAEAKASPSQRQPSITVESKPVEGPFRYRLGEPNVCVLDRAQWKLDDGQWREESEILRVDRAVRRALELPLRSGEMLQPWFSAQHETEVKGRVCVRYAFTVDALPRTAIELAVEEPDSFDIRINGCPLNQATECGFWVDPAFRRFPLPASVLRLGRNEIELETAFSEKSNLEAVYLLGAFGVRIEKTEVVVTELPETLSIGDLTGQGLPFYGAAVVYELPPIPATDGRQVVLRLTEIGAVCAKARHPAGVDQLIPWHPYEADVTAAAGQDGQLELELILSRRNTFGPLHELPLQVDWNGPNNFVTEGSQFSETPALTPTGLLKSPLIDWRKSPE